MRTFIAALAALVSIPGVAFANDYDSEILNPVTAPIARFVVRMAPELISDNVTTTRTITRDDLVSTRDAERLTSIFETALRKEFTRREVLADEGAAGFTFTATIVEVNSNNPGFTDRGFQRNVSPAFSVGQGRAAVEAVVTDADGVEIARFAYDYEELPLNVGLPGGASPSIQGGLNPRNPWFTARRVFRTFAKRSSKELAAALAEEDA